MYSVRVLTDGLVEFNGRRYVSVEGPASSHLSAEALATLTARLEQAPLGEWKSGYDTRTTTDEADVKLELRGRRISHYLGDASAPASLTQLEQDLDALLQTAQWVVGPSK